MEISYKKLDELVPYARNAKLHPDSQVARIARSISEFGFRNPVLVDGRGEIVAGHGRCLAARQAGLEQVPVIDASDMTEEQVRAYRIADNKLAESDWDWELAGTEVDELKNVGFDVELLGFDPSDLDIFEAPLEPFGETSTEKDGQGVSSTWSSVKGSENETVRIGKWETRISGMLAEKVYRTCLVEFESKGTPMHEKLEAILDAGCNS